jgi:hypothetical protein
MLHKETYSIILPIVLHDCEIWSLTLTEKLSFIEFEKRVLKRIFGTKKGNNWRLEKITNDKLHNLYSLPNIIKVTKFRRMRWVGHVARMGAMKNAYHISARKPEEKRPLGRSRYRWKNNIKT